MNELFEINDKHCRIAKLAIYALLIICGVLILTGSIILMCTGELTQGIVMLIAGMFSSFICYILTNLLFSFLLDVKFIRNKIYGREKDNYLLIQVAQQEVTTSKNSEKSEDDYTKLIKLNEIYKSGGLTKEEYEQQKKKLLK